MQSIRRAALRSAISASRAVSSTTRSSPFAVQIARKTMSPLGRPSSIRFFSQTGRVANEEKPVEETDMKPVEETEVKPAEETEVKPAEEATEAVKAAEEPVAATEEPTAATEGVETFAPGQQTQYGLFVRNLVFDANEEHLEALFSKYGKVNLAKVGRDAGKMSKGFGFVFFTNAQDQQAALDGLNNTFWHGRRLFVSLKDNTRNVKTRRPVALPSRSLYIGNIPYETTDAELNDLFASLDGVLDVRVAVDRTTGWPRGFCHVDFKDFESSAAGIEKLRGRQLGKRTLHVDYAVAIMRGEARGERRGERRDERRDERSEGPESQEF